MSGPTSRGLSLYRQLLRKGKQLQFTDKNYFFVRVRSEFQKNKGLTSEKDITFQQEKAEAFLKNNRLV